MADDTRNPDARTFLAALTGDPDAPVTFQTFTDPEAWKAAQVDGKGKPWPTNDQGEPFDPLAKYRHGSLSALLPWLSSLSAQGAGVYLMVNAGDGKGRGKRNVVELRALFVDDDKGQLDPAALPVPPSLVVRSKAGCHVYWRLRPGEPLDAFGPAQAALAARLGTDASMKDLPRVLRVPGFPHQKDPAAPFQVRLVSTSPAVYSVAEVLAGFGIDPAATKPPPAKPAPPVSRPVTGGTEDLALAARRYAVERYAGWPSSGAGTCPVCGDRGSFGRIPDSDPPRWSCFSTDHQGVGRAMDGGWYGDQLDLDAYAAGLDRVALLRREGFLVDRPRPLQRNARQEGRMADEPEDAGQPEAPPPEVLAGRWRWLREYGTWLSDAPPHRTYLLAQPGAGGAGMLPLGKVGMLAAGGGMGKTYALAQLALAVATGRPWLGTYPVTKPGPVLLALGEEEEEEIRRRLFYAARDLELTDGERREAERLILPLPLCGEHVALTYSPEEVAALRVRPPDPASPEATETPFARELRDRLQGAGVEWRLVILDPLSRFAGPDVEKENAAATRFVQALERMTRAPGNPTVLVAHHTNKTSRSSEATDATAARGASALTDGIRWQANLETVLEARRKGAPSTDARRSLPGVTRFVVSKNNYGPPAPVLYLRRGDHGVLSPISEREVDALINAAKAEAATDEPRPVANDGSEHM